MLLTEGEYSNFFHASLLSEFTTQPLRFGLQLLRNVASGLRKVKLSNLFEVCFFIYKKICLKY